MEKIYEYKSNIDHTEIGIKQFRSLFFIEMWERYAFYAFQSVFILFITFLKFSSKESYLTFGTFSALLWMSPTVGGLLADKILGHNRSLIIGAIIFSFGYALLGYSASDPQFVYIALAIIVVGNGLFKPMPSTMIANIYKNNSKKTKSAFTYYYMSIQIGGGVGILLAPQIAYHLGFSYAFISSSAGILIGLGNFLLKNSIMRRAGNIIDQNKMKISHISNATILLTLTFILSYYMFYYINTAYYVVSLLSIIIIIHLLLIAHQETNTASKIKLLIGTLLIIMAIPFWVIYNQIFSTFILFAKQNMNLSFFMIKLAPGNIAFFDLIGVLLVSPILVKIYKSLSNKKIHINIMYKFSVGQVFTALSILLLLSACLFDSHNGYVSVMWMLPVFILFAVGEVLISALGLAMIGSYFPKNIVGYAMGTWWLACAIGGLLTGKIASLFAVVPHNISPINSISIYEKYFSQLGISAIIVGMFYLFLAYLVSRATKHIIILP